MKKKTYFIDHTPFTSRYHPTDGRDVIISVGCRGRDITENNHTAFNDGDRGGLRLLTGEEVFHKVGELNAAEGWKRGDAEADGTPILTK